MSTETPDKTIARLTESNRRLANQIVGYGDRMQQTIAGIVKDAKVEALREAVSEMLAALTPPDRPNDAWAKSDKPPIMARDVKPLWSKR